MKNNVLAKELLKIANNLITSKVELSQSNVPKVKETYADLCDYNHFVLNNLVQLYKQFPKNEGLKKEINKIQALMRNVQISIESLGNFMVDE